MATTLSPTPEDVEKYQQMRARCRRINDRLLKTVPKEAFDDIGNALGVLRKGVLVLDSEDMMGVLADCCLFDWFDKKGKNLVQRYAETQRSSPGTDERSALDLYLRAEYRILLPHSTVPGAGVRCRDAWTREELFLMDCNFSQSPDVTKMGLATRICPFGDYWITTGAALPLVASHNLEAQIQGIRQGTSKWPDHLRDSLLIVRACLEAGAAEHIMYETSLAKPKGPPRSSGSTVEPTDLCPCRSGLMYKYCCGRVKATPSSS